MPDVTVRNETPEQLNVAFRFVAPASWTNCLRSGDSWHTHLPSTPFTIEVRVDTEQNHFSAEDSARTAVDISTGWLAGTASVVGGFMGSFVGGAAAGPLMGHAMAAGARFAQNADGMVITVGGVWIPFHNKTFAIRFDEGQGYSLWDVDENRKMS
ncbi:uncharacterized protein LAESUDRAFT_705368 [Laetiporus sulphureus 93-53]|uniref:Uncharacterized protein n=1 Tax=Laetiporus sulphureus 93-53 TaxID=1314785 RepID=A0A165CKS7_9APHY|nr:uncharacterized protein LAESUDRAFT_705368 [Laetiporus sulphureus 93-53]KZT02988.1 hypothetical protein LAESUDRAFT_705368 [Laetiporus sulphureus 93-53]